MTATRVLLVDDHPLVLSGLRVLLEGEDDLLVVGEAPDGATAMRLLVEHRPNVAVVDLGLPDVSGALLCRQMLVRHPDVRLVVLTMHDDDQHVVQALSAGASAYLLKGSSPRDVIDTVRQVARGNLVVAAGVRRTVEAELVGSARVGVDLLGELTARERDVLELLAHGMSTAQIGSRLGVTSKTVRNRLSEVFAKLGVRDRVSAVVLAREAGLGRGRVRPAPGPAPR